MLLPLEPLLFFERITNVVKLYSITSNDSRQIRSVYGGLLRGEMRAPCDRWQTPYAYGIHELIYDGGGAVDTYVS